MKALTLSIGSLLLVGAAFDLLTLAGRGKGPTGTLPVDQAIDQAPPYESAKSDTPSAGDITSDASDSDSVTPHLGDSESNDSRTILDEDLRWAREETRKDVTVTYSLMSEHLALTESEYTAMIDFLVEIWMSGTYMAGYRPVPIEEADRRAGVAALIGEVKLERLLALEQNKAEYREAQRVANLLEANGVPLTHGDMDQLLEILIQVRGREQAVADPDAESGTLEWIASKIATMDEYERLGLELAPSVLFTDQVVLLYDRYHSFWIKRAAHFERQERSRSNYDPDDDVPLGYFPRN